MASSVFSASAALCVLLVIWLYRINANMASAPREAAKLSPRRWSSQDIKATAERLKKQPVDFSKQLPPALKRRYVIVGGSGWFILSSNAHLTRYPRDE